VHSGQGQVMFRGGARVIIIDLVQRSVLDDDDNDADLWGIICERSGIGVVLDLLVSCWRGLYKEVGVGCRVGVGLCRTDYTMEELMCNMLVLGGRWVSALATYPRSCGAYGICISSLVYPTSFVCGVLSNWALLRTKAVHVEEF
jgi:hypothetical protein